MLGHDGPPTQFWDANLLTGEPLQRCPVRDLLEAQHNRPRQHAELYRYLGIYHPAWRDGHLLVAGGIADQPARYLEMIRLIADLAAESEVKFYQLDKEPKE